MGGEAGRIPWLNASTVDSKQLFFLSEVSNLILHFPGEKNRAAETEQVKKIWLSGILTTSPCCFLSKSDTSWCYLPLLFATSVNKTHVIKLTFSIGFCLVFIISTFVFGDMSKSKVKVSTGAPKHSFFYEGNCIISFITRILLVTRNVSLKVSRAERMCLDDSCPSELGNCSNRLFVVSCREVLLRSGWWSQVKVSSGLDEFQSCCFHFSLRNHKMSFLWATWLIHLIMELLSVWQ